MKKMDEQKLLREKIAQEKAEKRKIFQTVCSGGGSSSNIMGGNVKRQTSTCNIINDRKNLEQSTNPQITKTASSVDKNISPIKSPTQVTTTTSSITTSTTKPSKSIRISGLAIDIRESLLRKITRPYGMVESIVFIEQQQQQNETKSAIVNFIQTNDAKKFMDNFLHMDKTKLTQSLLIQSDKLPTLSFINWFVFNFLFFFF
ncbi:hypothetical protein BLA29_010554 [Euroglyphus maynei]|uniref:RRM domain-containing protein n=1 Tax=Euroglyphus maynei TaxID=6958 RepID=A0A1Y3BS66_EURMA|nr:hypothetical protein BLA29_010554 [Euroglyphus maynei]